MSLESAALIVYCLQGATMRCNDGNAGIHGIEFLAAWEVVSNVTFCIQLCNDVEAIQESNETTTYIPID